MLGLRILNLQREIARLQYEGKVVVRSVGEG
jgi:hypothetical protein